MGCANCKRATDAKNPTPVPSIFLDKNLIARHDIRSLQKEIAERGPEFFNLFLQENAKDFIAKNNGAN